MTDRETRFREIAERYLPEEALRTIRARAARHDAENSFAADDLADLRELGYLTVFVPAEFGGPGLTLNEVARLQQRLATAAPATALAVNMHLMCTGVVRALHERGDTSLDWVFEDALAGEVFAFGISEPNNDWVLQGSNTRAVPTDDGGYLLSGVKIFTSLTPAWTRLIVHARDDSDPSAPMIVYGFLDRDAGGIEPSDDWDVMGMRASHSRATVLTEAPMRPERVSRRIPDGPNPDPLTFAITANFQLLVGAVYAGVAKRALDLAAQALGERSSAKRGVTLAEVPEFRVRLADAHRTYLGAAAQLDAYTRDFDERADHGAGWPLRLVSARLAAGEAARTCADAALQCAGGRAFSNASELARLYRDAAASIFHPPGADAARPMFAAALLDD
ncbi:acyl-CoA dehydrogenase [Brevibacterium sp. 5221]|uniref:Acyl-CoA dehydrogenase n=1 Tax=Brevibacterium rongguiense TaxID=2695267 RepID=A0A6N9H7X6_9MICO|nr:acyl-CoA dehydrogenase family protein [Brevibacterium rongguiense]MYM20158.1 acyl-CoA dehydrogenase [Brevibacterium rongguiense]